MPLPFTDNKSSSCASISQRTETTTVVGTSSSFPTSQLLLLPPPPSSSPTKKKSSPVAAKKLIPQAGITQQQETESNSSGLNDSASLLDLLSSIKYSCAQPNLMRTGSNTLSSSERNSLLRQSLTLNDSDENEEQNQENWSWKFFFLPKHIAIYSEQQFIRCAAYLFIFNQWRNFSQHFFLLFGFIQIKNNINNNKNKIIF